MKDRLIFVRSKRRSFFHFIQVPSRLVLRKASAATAARIGKPSNWLSVKPKTLHFLFRPLLIFPACVPCLAALISLTPISYSLTSIEKNPIALGMQSSKPRFARGTGPLFLCCKIFRAVQIRRNERGPIPPDKNHLLS